MNSTAEHTLEGSSYPGVPNGQLSVPAHVVILAAHVMIMQRDLYEIIQLFVPEEIH
jgi:hypothetical protein